MLIVPTTANAAVKADLRVEGDGKALAAATYLTGTARIRTTSSSTCQGSGEVKTVPGSTALGLLSSGAGANSALRPLAVSDQFDFGLFVCGVARFAGSDSAYWLYKVDHKAPEVGADQYALHGGEDVLWYFSDTVKGVNTGAELALKAPARAKPGATVRVQVFAYDTNGKRTPAGGATVHGAGDVQTDADGRASITAPTRGSMRLRAVRAADIESQTLSVCITATPSCAARRGERIYGTKGADRITGTAGPDSVYAGRGNDAISVRGGGRDLVRCGRGRDRVKADRRDRVAHDCEVVKRR
jgi:hypothetical protein